MSDLVKRLRGVENSEKYSRLIWEAADEIERLGDNALARSFRAMRAQRDAAEAREQKLR